MRPSDHRPKRHGIGVARARRFVAGFRRASARYGRSVLDAIFPQGCAGCGAVSRTQHGFLCLDCREILEACESPDAVAAPEIGRARLVCAPYRYVAAIREFVLRVKFGHERRLAGALGWALAERIPCDIDGPVDAVVPVPLARRRFLARGFNQAYEIARPVAVVLGPSEGALPILDRVLDRAAGGTQSRLGASARQRNAVHAFRVCGRIDGMRLLLVDDVLTTGNTLRACARELHRAGADRIDAAVVAVSPAPGEATRDDR